LDGRLNTPLQVRDRRLQALQLRPLAEELLQELLLIGLSRRLRRRGRRFTFSGLFTPLEQVLDTGLELLQL